MYFDPSFTGPPTEAEATVIRQQAVAARRAVGGVTTLERAISRGEIPVALGTPGAVTPGAVSPEYMEQAQAQVGQVGLGLAALIPAALKILPKVWPYAAGAIAGIGLGGLFGGGEDGLAELSPTGGMPVPIGGPGLAEPGAPYLIKEWHVTYPKGRIQYYLVQRASLSGAIQRYIMAYKTWDGTWKWWRWRSPSLAVIGKNMPSHKMITRLRRNLQKHSADAKTILKLTQPLAYAKTVGYRKYGKRR
ncbi:unnamed protein product, partial [marine sediment metagenome]